MTLTAPAPSFSSSRSAFERTFDYLSKVSPGSDIVNIPVNPPLPAAAHRSNIAAAAPPRVHTPDATALAPSLRRVASGAALGLTTADVQRARALGQSHREPPLYAP